MAWASGSFSRLYGATGWQTDLANNIYILASRHDAHDQDMADGVNACLTRDNQAKPTASFTPQSTNAIDLGSSSFSWRNVYLGTNKVAVWNDAAQILGYYGQTPAELAAGVTPVNYYRFPSPFYDVSRMGVVGDGTTDDTAALTNAINGCPNYGILIIPPGFNCKIGQAHVASKNLTIMADGARFTLNGNSAGFLIDGICTYFRWYGGYFIGDNTNRDGTPSNAQIAISFGNSSGAQCSNFKGFGIYVSSANVGFRISDGRGGGGTKAYNCHLIGCYVYNSVGTVGGVGYGFQFSQADGSGLVGCVADTCGRHGVYFSEGQDYTASDITVKNCGFGSARGGFIISRSANVAVSAITSINNNDYGLVIDTDNQGLAPDNVLNNVTITGYTAYGNLLGDIRIGTSAAPGTDGVPKNVTINGASIRTATSSSNSSIVVWQVNGLVMKGIQIDASAASSTNRAVAFTGSGGATYTDNVVCEIDRITTASSGYGIQIDTSLQTGSTTLRFELKQLVGGGSNFDFTGGEDSTTNNNLYYRAPSGFATRTYSSSGSLITIAVGGINKLTFSPSAATTVSNFSGGVEGAVLYLFFTNASTTLKNTNFYLAGAVDFVSTANDTLTLQYVSGAWREIGRSIN